MHPVFHRSFPATSVAVLTLVSPWLFHLAPASAAATTGSAAAMITTVAQRQVETQQHGSSSTTNDLLAMPKPSSTSPPLDFSKDGPFAHMGIARVSASLAVQLDDNSSCTLKITASAPDLHSSSSSSTSSSNSSSRAVTKPASDLASSSTSSGNQDGKLPRVAQAGHFPLLLLLNGFQLPSSFYHTYASRLVSWGYAVLQYDLPGLLLKRVIRDDKEVALLPQLIAWVQAQVALEGSPLHQAVDMSRLGLLGHSRGAKLAALMLAGQQGSIGAAVLVDPVDMTAATQRLGYPSAVEALRGSGKVALTIGAGISGSCNPAAQGYTRFWEVLDPGSWQLVVAQAGHMQFTDAAGAAGWALDRMCGAGRQSHQAVMEVASTAAVAWMEQHFRPGDATEVAAALFRTWLQERQSSGAISFDVKASKA